MSTKIYNGFCVDTGDFLANWRQLGLCKPGVQRLVDNKHRRLLARRLSYKADLWTLGLSGQVANADALHEQAQGTWHAQWLAEKDEIPWMSEQHRLLHEQRLCRAGPSREPEVDCDVQLFLRVHPCSGRILGYLQEERVGAYAHLLTLEGFAEFGYWNNTDPPPELAAQQWLDREEAWLAVLRDEVAAVVMHWEPSFAFAQEIAAALPSLKERATRLSLQELRCQALDHARADLPEPASNSLSWAVACLRRLQESLAEPHSELSLRHARRTEEFQALLVADLSDKLDRPWSQWMPAKP